MAFEFLLCDCLIHGKSSHSESSKGVSLKPQIDESILFFQTDCPNFRKSFGCNNVCDLVVLSAKKGRDPALLFVELKGSDAGHGVKQIKSTAKAINDKIDNKVRARFIRRALLVMSGSAPSNLKKLRKTLDFTLDVKAGVKKKPIDARQFIP